MQVPESQLDGGQRARVPSGEQLVGQLLPVGGEPASSSAPDRAVWRQVRASRRASTG
ncbi:hypothetical protein [Streptomyces phaeoluteigriseus]|uniref:hypothetical protein n=1 Tax=Streptomyces phaeoluteigriseus TaxID=114686 RepID=UPI001FE5C916|nr:hypothetical protein [Streptomyces phaeoluteigriseus]